MWMCLVHYTYKTTQQSLSKGRPCGNKVHATCIMSAGYSAAIKCRLFFSAMKKKEKKACDMFIKQQGSHYCTHQPPSQCSHIAAWTCSLGTGRLIVTFSSCSNAVLLFQFLESVSFLLVCSQQVAHVFCAIFRVPAKSLQTMFTSSPSRT